MSGKRDGALRRSKTSIFMLSTLLVLLTGCSSTAGTITGSPDTPAPTQADTLHPFDPFLPGLYHYFDLRTGATRTLPHNIADSWSLVSPDGTMYVWCRAAQSPLLVASVDGSDERRVTPKGVNACLGGWSPDGSMIAYETYADGLRSGNVFTVDLSTGETTQLTDLGRANTWTEVTNMEPAFTPDGRSVLFHRPRLTAHVWDIWSVPVTGGEPTIVQRNAGWGRYSPDGQTLAFLRQDDDGDLGGRIFIANAAGGAARLLVEGDQNGPPLWSPDGTRIAYLGEGGVRVLDLATGKSSVVAWCGGGVEWFDDDTLILGPGGCGLV